MSIKDLLEKDQHYTNMLRLPEHKEGVKKAAAFFAHSADSWFWGAALVLLWFIGPSSWRPQIITLLLGIFITAVCVLGLKFLIRRPRPESDWGQVYRRSDPHSFPSGHAARAIMLTTIILLSGQIWIGIIMMLWTILVDLARISLGIHYISDIAAGSVIGIIMGMVTPMTWLPQHNILHELIYWVDEEHRGGTAGYRLLAQYVEAGKELLDQGRVSASLLGKMDNSPNLKYDKFGYHKVEEFWVMGV